MGIKDKSWRIKNWCMTILFTIFMVTMSSVSYAVSVCFTQNDVTTRVMEHYEGAKLAYEIKDREAAEFMKVYNALPPVSNFIADKIIVITHPAYANTLVFGFSNGCKTFSDKSFLKRDLLRILSPIYGVIS